MDKFSKSIQKDTPKIQNPHEVLAKDRSQLKMTGVIEVISATSTTINAKTDYGPILITGNELRVNLLDIESKVVEILGEINEIKYLAHKKTLLQRLFK